MLFRRRDPESFYKRARKSLFLDGSAIRSIRYSFKRMLRLSASPHKIALGAAVGGFWACSPFLGAQFLFSWLSAWAVRGNIPAALLGTMLANPFTIPFILGLDYKIGYFLASFIFDFNIQEDILTNLADLYHHFRFEELKPLLLPLLSGSVVLGGAFFVFIYIIIFFIIDKFKKKRRRKINLRKTGQEG